ncbi:MAG: DUF5107 domain-containing protein [Pirellulaceae bacterium]|jgi:tetratricopeptide (TPR) repeat protein|nr:DUF5107 domain-containing protein [Pirellulaceae bacterium]
MKTALAATGTLVFVLILGMGGAGPAGAEVRAWQTEVTIPTYIWHEDINPKFWALEGGARLSTTVQGAIVYPYVMQDHLLRDKMDRAYKALCLENEFLQITCLPELGGRLHAVLDKTRGVEMFYRNGVIKPSMIAMRGAWISGGVEWNAGPHGHTVTAIAPVNALFGTNADGSVYLEISNLEQIFRTRWTVRVTLHPGRAYLDEQICLTNPTDGMHPYYFWNCTAFPNRAGTRFIYPMSLGTDHNAREFFDWPVDGGRDLSWLKNYETYASIFAVNCPYDFFGAYDVDADGGIVQVADRRELGGKKAWTWGEWDFGQVSQQNLTDAEGPYIEVQSGPLPTQSDYGMLGPRERVAWREWWYPVHGLGDGFEYATRDVAVQTARRDDTLEVRLLATGEYPQAQCELRLPPAAGGQRWHQEQLDLSPRGAVRLTCPDPQQPVEIVVTSQDGVQLAAFTSPLPVPPTPRPTLPDYVEPPDDELTVEQLFLKGRQHDRATERRAARRNYELALARDPGHVDSLRALAVLDYEAGHHEQARERLRRAVARDRDDGLSCYYLAVCALELGELDEALDWAGRAVRCPGTTSLGHDLAGRVHLQQGRPAAAIAAFQQAVRANRNDRVAADHLTLALYAAGEHTRARRWATRRAADEPTALVPRAVLCLLGDTSPTQFAQQVRGFLGDADFELLELSLTLVGAGLVDEAQRLVAAACVESVPSGQRQFLPLYYLAWFEHLRGCADAARHWLEQAAGTSAERVFASRTADLPILRYATAQQPDDAQAQLQLGCLLAHLDRVDEAVPCWTAAAQAGNTSIAWRNLALAAAAADDLRQAEQHLRRAIAVRPNDQTLYRDLAELLIADQRRPEAIELLEAQPVEGLRRAEISVLLAESYVATSRYDDCIKLLESLPYFVNWEGQDVTWRLFNRAHVERGRERLAQGDKDRALADFEAALTYPANLNVGRSNKPVEAPAQYWRGEALRALGRLDAARAAWRAGAEGADVAGWQNEHRDKCREALDRSGS